MTENTKFITFRSTNNYITMDVTVSIEDISEILTIYSGYGKKEFYVVMKNGNRYEVTLLEDIQKINHIRFGVK